MIILYFGPPGVGKGTQAQLAAERLQLAHLSTGDAFRRAIQLETEVGLLAKQYVESGSLVPDSVVAKIVEEAMLQPEYENGVILDGFPRTVPQADALAELLEKTGKKVNAVVNITVEHDEIVRRLLARGRKDDSEEIIRHRLELYEKETAPLLEYYSQSAGVVRTIDGNADVETVYSTVVASLSDILP